MSAWAEAVYLLNKITEKFTALATLVNAVKTSAASAATDAATAKTNASNANTNASTAATRAQSIIDTLGSRGTGSTVYSILGTVNTNASNAASRAQSILTAINNGGMNTSAVKSIQTGTFAQVRTAGEAANAGNKTITVSSVNLSKSVLLIDFAGSLIYSPSSDDYFTYALQNDTVGSPRMPKLTAATTITVYPWDFYYLQYNSYDQQSYAAHASIYFGFNWTLIEFY